MTTTIHPLLVYLPVVNAIAAILFAYDKRAAIHRVGRVPETTLLGIALLGGWPAALVVSHWIRHKTRKQSFRLRLYAMVPLSIALLSFGLTTGMMEHLGGVVR